MASSQLFIVISILAIFTPSALAKRYVVGDEKGWDVRVDYEAWAKTKHFSVGDTITFKYPKGEHNVIEVSDSEFEKCRATSSDKTLTSGEDKVTLDAPGKRYFICSVGKHCEMGKQKVAITVGSAAPSSSPSSSPSNSVPDIPSPSTSTSTSPSSDDSTPTTPSASTPSSNASAATGTIVGNGCGTLITISGILGLLMA